ncbi:MAG: hypothetical protein KC486_35490, partial [Myxococcales bacterium]|nr:hypothetical protein [Myxococcales bacterium]
MGKILDQLDHVRSFALCVPRVRGPSACGRVNLARRLRRLTVEVPAMLAVDGRGQTPVARPVAHPVAPEETLRGQTRGRLTQGTGDARPWYERSMLPLTPDVGAAGPLLGALAAVSDAPEDPRVRRFAAFVAGELGVDLDPEEEFSAPSAEALAAAVADPSRAAATQRLILAAMLVPPLGAARLERLEAYADALGRRAADEPALGDLRR